MDYDEYEEKLTKRREEDEVIESNLELQRWLNDPTSRKSFEEINKDIPLSNLTNEDVEFIDNCLELQRQLQEENAQAFAGAIRFFRFLAFARANISLGRQGFGRKQIGTIRREESLRTEDGTRKGFFGKNK